MAETRIFLLTLLFWSEGCSARTKKTPHDPSSSHPHGRRLHRRPVRRRLPFGPQGRQRRFLHGQPPHSMVYGRSGHDRRSHIGRDLHFGARIGGRRLLLLHADGVGIHGRADGCRLRADPALL